MMSLLLHSLERTAELTGDIAGEVYVRYFERCPESRTIMNHTDEHMRGRMLEEVYRLLMSESVADEQGYLAFETGNHRAYGAASHMYRNLLLAVQDVVARSLGDEFTPDLATAWAARIDELLGVIEPLTNPA